jgi:hypothetical protein
METIKEIGKFIKWQWDKIDTPTKFLLLTLIWMISLLIGLYIIGPVAFAWWFGGFGVFLLGLILKATVETVMESWKKFQQEQEAERQAVVDRLRGDVIPFQGSRAEDIIAKLKARRGA